MPTVTLAEAKAQLSALVEQAARGETVRITRRGKPIAQIGPIQQPRKKIDVSELRKLTESMPFQAESAGEFMRRLRDEDRY
jgi:prevent-host-death family protein